MERSYGPRTQYVKGSMPSRLLRYPMWTTTPTLPNWVGEPRLAGHQRSEHLVVRSVSRDVEARSRLIHACRRQDSRPIGILSPVLGCYIVGGVVRFNNPVVMHNLGNPQHQGIRISHTVQGHVEDPKT
ncbi:hypothetical protein C8J57DRAFT_1230979 [Mycena rebaudengoi]|nr:hypothetical protein C8J57DRAFT_1230979 [Mycena rebaudengoi]